MQGITIQPRALDYRRVDQPLGARPRTDARHQADVRQGSIGILTFHRCINYGSYWQARCLAEGMAAHTGARVRILDHASRKVEIKEWRCALRPELSSPGDRKAHADKIRSFAQAQNALPLSDRFALCRPEAAGRHETVVVGSDEVWNFRHPWYAASPPFFGDDMEADRLVAYAASFGNHDAADGIHPDYCDRLRRFAAISVRDQNSARLIRDALGIEPEMVLDPCLLFPDCIAAGEPEHEPRLILYGHDFPHWIVEQVHGFARRRGLRIVSLGYHNPWADEQRLAAGPEAFSSAIASAAAVVTNFFHGCVFSLVFGRPFVTAPSDYRFNKIRDLADLVGVQDRILRPDLGSADYARLLSEPAPESANARITSLRRASADYLRMALSA